MLDTAAVLMHRRACTIPCNSMQDVHSDCFHCQERSVQGPACRVLNVWDKLLYMCLPARFRFDEDDDSNEYVEQGRLLLRKEQVTRLCVAIAMFTQHMPGNGSNLAS